MLYATHPPHGTAQREASAAPRRDGYARHRPEDGALYQAIAAHWSSFKEEMEEHRGLPDFVVQQFERFLTCGILEHGCLHLQCRQCGHSQLVAFSCKGRGLCNSCAGRRMVHMAVHLEAHVLPEVNIRHWNCSLPWGVRALLGCDKELCAATLAAFVKECRRSLTKRAKALLGLDSVRHALTAAVAAIQRTDSALRLNVHFHVLVRWSSMAFTLVQVPMCLSPAQKQVVDGRDRRQLERLCRYLLRPPIAEERLSVRSDGTLLLESKKSWRDGTRAVVLTSRDLLVRLCASIPLPYVDQVRYFGVLASAAAHRDEVVPRAQPAEGAFKPPEAAGDQLELLQGLVPKLVCRPFRLL